jgi:hypothetical protein
MSLTATPEQAQFMQHDAEMRRIVATEAMGIFSNVTLSHNLIMYASGLLFRQEASKLAEIKETNQMTNTNEGEQLWRQQ